VSVFVEESRHDRDAEWEPNPPPSPLRAAAALAMPDLLRALEPFVNRAVTDLARLDTGSHSTEESFAGSRIASATHQPVVDSDAALRRFVVPPERTMPAPGGTTIDVAKSERPSGVKDFRGSMQSSLLDGLDAVRPRLAEPESLFPRTDYSSGGTVPSPSNTHSSGLVETGWPQDVSSGRHAPSRASLVQTPVGDSRSLEGDSGGSSGLDGAGAETIAELASRLLQAVTRLEHLAERHNTEVPRPYRSAPRPFRDRVDG
jgi:hypothetical protein